MILLHPCSSLSQRKILRLFSISFREIQQWLDMCWYRLACVIYYQLVTNCIAFGRLYCDMWFGVVGNLLVLYDVKIYFFTKFLMQIYFSEELESTVFRFQCWWRHRVLIFSIAICGWVCVSETQKAGHGVYKTVRSVELSLCSWLDGSLDNGT